MSKVPQGYYMISSYSYLKELNYEYKYMNYEYDVLEGTLPKEKTDLVLVIDKNNCISRTVLTSLGIDTTNLTEFKFSDIIGKTYRLATNDIYYVKDGNKYITYNKANTSITDLYNNSKIELEIKGIVRQKPTAKTKLYGTCILYSPELTDYVLERNNNSAIVQEQKTNPEVNVLTGEKFEIIESSSSTQTIEYQYEKNLSDFGANYNITRIMIYTDKFENFSLIHDYIEEYNVDKVSVSQIKYTDYLKNMVDEFEMFLDVLTKVLLVFATISLLVAAIMIIVITYVSVIEQTKQVGILRSIGFRKNHVTGLFVYENIIIGLSSGILGVILGTILIKPVLSIIITVMKDVNLTSFSVESLKMNGFNIFHLILVIVGSVILTVLSGIIPSLMASKQDPVKALNQ
jgi:ABC-type antimicrobial peptide transport system permease subunit